MTLTTTLFSPPKQTTHYYGLGSRMYRSRLGPSPPRAVDAFWFTGTELLLS